MPLNTAPRLADRSIRLKAAPTPSTVGLVFTFVLDAARTAGGHAPTAFMAFFVYVWLLWCLKALAARRYRPSDAPHGDLTVSVLVPVFKEPEAIFRRVLASVRAE